MTTRATLWSNPNARVRKMASSFNKMRKVSEKNQICDGTLHPSPFGIYDLLNTQKCLKDFFVQRGMFGDYATISEVNQNGTSSLRAKEKDDKINKVIKSIVEKSIADIAKMRQLIALWDAEERSTSHSYIDESSYGLVTQQKIKQYLRDFFSERLTSAEHPIDLQDIADSSTEGRKEDDTGPSLSSPIIGKAMNMISQVIQPVVDTIDSASKVTKAVVKMLARSDRDDQEMAKESDEGAKQKSPKQVSHRYSAAEDTGAPHSSSTAVGKERTVMHAKKDEDHLVHPVPSSEEDRNQTSRLSSVMPESVEDSSSANKVRSVRKDDNRVAPAMFNEAVMDELCNLQYEIQLTPRLSPILEETGETNSSASSSAIVDKMGFLEGESISSLLVPSESAAVTGSSVPPTPATSTFTLEKRNIQSEVPAQRKEAEKPCSTDMELTRQVSSLSGGKPDAMGDRGDDKISIAESSEEEATQASAAIEAWSTSRLLSVSPVSSTATATSSPIIEKAKTIISNVMQPVVDTIDSASKVTKTAGKSIAKKVKSMWKYRSGRKKGKRGKGKSDKNAARNGQQDILDKHSGEDVTEDDKMEDENDAEDEDGDDEGDEETSTAEVDSFSELSGAFNDGEVVGTSDAPPSIVEDNTVPKPAEVLNDVAVEEFCFFEAESSSVISTPFLDATMTISCDPTSSSLAAPQQAKPENSTPDILEDEQLSSNSKSPENKLRVAETDEEQASDINGLQSEDDGPEHNIYSIFENIFREEFSKKLENSLRQGLCDAVRVYVPERSSTESFESTNISCELGDHYTKKDVETSSVGPQDSLDSGSTSIISFASYQHLSDASLKGIPPEGLDSKRKSLWKRWKMRRARKILPGLLECHCTPRASDSVASDSKATEPAIKSILKKVTSIWK